MKDSADAVCKSADECDVDWILPDIDRNALLDGESRKIAGNRNNKRVHENQFDHFDVDEFGRVKAGIEFADHVQSRPEFPEIAENDGDK